MSMSVLVNLGTEYRPCVVRGDEIEAVEDLSRSGCVETRTTMKSGQSYITSRYFKEILVDWDKSLSPCNISISSGVLAQIREEVSA
jgi:hypothetical protein